MTKFNKELVDLYAKKLLIELTEEENKTVLEEFEEIDKEIDLINEIDNIENTIPQFYPYEIILEDLREDMVLDEITVTEALSNCDDVENDSVAVPKVVG